MFEVHKGQWRESQCTSKEAQEELEGLARLHVVSRLQT